MAVSAEQVQMPAPPATLARPTRSCPCLSQRALARLHPLPGTSGEDRSSASASGSRYGNNAPLAKFESFEAANDSSIADLCILLTSSCNWIHLFFTTLCVPSARRNDRGPALLTGVCTVRTVSSRISTDSTVSFPSPPHLQKSGSDMEVLCMRSSCGEGQA